MKGSTATDLALFRRQLGAMSPLSPADMQAVAPLLHARELLRGQHLLRAGERAEHVAMVVLGAVREYYVLEDGSERTKAFVFAGELTGSLADLLSDAPSSAFVVAEEDTRMLSARYADFLRLAAESPSWDRVFRRLIERLYLRKARREYELLALDANARYRQLLAERPDIEQHVQARHIASYLGITPVHLSRLRRRKRS